jgi:hypothetical protein
MHYSKKKEEPAKNLCTLQGSSETWQTLVKVDNEIPSLTYFPLFTAVILYIITTQVWNTQSDMTFNTCLITREHYIPSASQCNTPTSQMIANAFFKHSE